MPYGSLLADTVQSSTSGPATFKNTSGTEIGTLCRAWVNFNGTGTVAIRASFNVSSITDNGAGDYTVNFTNAMPDANYATIGSASGNSSYTGDGTGPGVSIRMSTTTPTLLTTTQVRINCGYGNTTGSDLPATVMNVAFFR
jgi:hypothetical protein